MIVVQINYIILSRTNSLLSSLEPIKEDKNLENSMHLFVDISLSNYKMVNSYIKALLNNFFSIYSQISS